MARAAGSKLLAFAALLLPHAAGAQPADAIARIMERLDRLERENRELKEQVRQLSERLGGTPAAEAGTAAAAPKASAEERLDIAERRIEEQAQTKVEASQKFPVRLAGMVLFNAFANSRQSGGADYPVVAAATGPGHDGATVRQSIVGLEFEDPAAVWGGKVHGSIYMDFFSGGTASNFRVRTATIELDWKSRTLAAGLEKPIFNPREPSSLAQVGLSPLTGAGNLWLWIPQVRFEQEIMFAGSTGLRAQVGAVQTREIGAYTGTITAEAARPGFEGRFNFFHRLDSDRRLEMAVGFHSSTTHAGGVAIPSNLVSADWFFNPWKPVELSGAFYSGTNVAHLGSGTRQGFGAYEGRLYGIGSMGGWGQVTVHAAPRWDFHFFTGQVDDSNRYLVRGAIGRNLLYGGNVYFRIAPNVITALE
ncbi:MAG: hypothetical protein JST11_13695, partial [Acidobacteria bacterium]|nr:hypothetical protein [Acidobacteriota bacterium]